MPKKPKSACCTPEDVPALTGDVGDDLALLSKAMGHPARVMIMQILAKSGTCLSGSLADQVDLAPSTVSEHLRMLKEAGLVQGTIDGPRRCYCVNPKTLNYWKRLVTDV